MDDQWSDYLGITLTGALSVVLASTVLFVAVAFYAWGMIRVLERRRTGLPPELAPLHPHHEEAT